MSSLAKMLSILDLFAVDRPVLTVEDITTELQFTRPTGYRYLRELHNAGLITRFGGGFSLGPRAIELDYIIRESDPLLVAGKPVMEELCERYGCHVTLLSLINDKIICVDHISSSSDVTVTYGRGHVMPVLRGAGAKAILSKLPRSRQRRLFALYPEEHAASVLGQTVAQFCAALQEIRKAEHAISLGELDQNSVGIAVPIVNDDASLASAIVIVLSKQRFVTVDLSLMTRIVKNAAKLLMDNIEHAANRTVPLVQPARRRAKDR
jgi:DNA-binding IclR family transcriptional regulator